MAYYVPPSKNVGGHVPRVPHQIAPMAVWDTVLQRFGCTSKKLQSPTLETMDACSYSVSMSGLSPGPIDWARE